MQSNYLFVCGCPRSGTTALAKLLMTSQQIRLGIERYGSKIDGRFRIRRRHFETERFFDIQPDDTFYKSFQELPNIYTPSFKEFFARAKYVGDKIPRLYCHYQAIFDEFPEATVIFIFRNLTDVASSVQKRWVIGDRWRKSWDYKWAVNEWNASLRETDHAIAAGSRVIPVSYEQVLDDEEQFKSLFTLLNIDESSIDYKSLRRILQRHQNLTKERSTTLDPSQIEFVKAREDSELYRRLLAHSVNSFRQPAVERLRPSPIRGENFGD